MSGSIEATILELGMDNLPQASRELAELLNQGYTIADVQNVVRYHPMFDASDQRMHFLVYTLVRW